MQRLLFSSFILATAFQTTDLRGEESDTSPATALSRYVNKADASYSWKVRRTGKIGFTTCTEIILTSQTWRDIKWQHQLFLLRPASWIKDDVSHALLLVEGGSWNDRYAEPAGDDEPLPEQAKQFAALAEAIGTPLAILRQVPQQPLYDGLREDNLIAYTFENYLKDKDDTWPLLLPMTKSAVKGMDAVQEFAEKEWDAKIDGFTVTGASKRGWTTWLTSATDPRVKAAAPMVIDVLNMQVQMPHQKAVWSKASDEISEYTDRGLDEQFKTEQGQQLVRIVDPYFYRDKTKQPKLIVIGTNDRYWPVDALNIYWDELEGPNYILYVPNNGHGIQDYKRVIGSISALHQSIARNKALPKLDWNFTETDKAVDLTLKSDAQPQAVRLWTATSETRDFRDAKWTSSAVDASDTKGLYKASTDLPASGFKATFLEAEYPGVPAANFSTNLRILGPKGLLPAKEMIAE